MNRLVRRLRGGSSGAVPVGSLPVGFLLVGLLLAAPFAFAAQNAEPTRVAVIDIDRVAQESSRGQAMFTELQTMQEEILRGRQQREQEIRDLTNRAQSQLLSAEARADLTRDIERKNTDLQRWLEDQQRAFNEQQTTGFTALEADLGPVVEEVARERNIQLILRVTPGLTFIMDPALDISAEVITRFNALSDGGEDGQE